MYKTTYFCIHNSRDTDRLFYKSLYILQNYVSKGILICYSLDIIFSCHAYKILRVHVVYVYNTSNNYVTIFSNETEKECKRKIMPININQTERNDFIPPSIC